MKDCGCAGPFPAVPGDDRHREIPIGHGHIGADRLQGLLELIQIDAVPRQEAFPTVLAMVLVDQREVIVIARVFRPFVQLVEAAEGKA